MTIDNPAVADEGRSALRKASWRLLPMIGLGYGIAYLDRVNISFAALQMNDDLRFSAAVYGLGGGLFFLAYALFEVPSNLILVRVGARRWIARIMFTWGLLAAGMMFVRTPMAFYVMRFLLGLAEAGFFPGVVYYLSQWFPAAHRGRAISRFYVALPFSSVVMGVLAGPLLGLQGVLGLAGWQWLFLVEGAPAVILSIVVLNFLPDAPETARWLTPGEKTWIRDRLAADVAAIGGPADHSLLRALRHPLVWGLGLANVCILGCSYAFTLSAPAILKAATGLDATRVGWVVAAAALASAAGMIANGWHSDHTRERHLHVATPLALAGVAYAAIGLSAVPLVIVGAYAVTVFCSNAVQSVFWSLPGESLHGRSAAIGVAAVGSIGMIGSFVGPYVWGLAKDRTGDYQAGLLSLFAALMLATGMILLLRRSALATGRAGAVAAATP